MHYLPRLCSHFKSWFKSDCLPCPLPLLFSRWQSSSSRVPSVAAAPPHRLTARQPTESDLFCIVPPRLGCIRLDKWLKGVSVGAHAAITCGLPLPFYTTPPKRLVWWTLPCFYNLSTQAYLKGVADLFIWNTNATFWVTFQAVGMWDKTPAWWIILWQKHNSRLPPFITVC